MWSFSGHYFSVFSPNTGKYGPEKTPNFDTFHAVSKYPYSVEMQENTDQKKLHIGTIFTVNYFHKSFHHRCLTDCEIRLCDLIDLKVSTKKLFIYHGISSKLFKIRTFYNPNILTT